MCHDIMTYRARDGVARLANIDCLCNGTQVRTGHMLAGCLLCFHFPTGIQYSGLWGVLREIIIHDKYKYITILSLCIKHFYIYYEITPASWIRKIFSQFDKTFRNLLYMSSSLRFIDNALTNNLFFFFFILKDCPCF